MKPAPIVAFLAALVLLGGQSAPAQETPRLASDPPELAAKREEYLRAMQRASITPLTNYLRQLEPLKEQFAKHLELPAALAVENEITKVKQQLDAANATAQGALHSVNLPVEITSALWQGSDVSLFKDVTAHLRKMLNSGVANVPVGNHELGSDTDPAPYQRKTLVIEYKVNGVVKKKSLAEGDKLNFRDLK